jgi:hypothetical protein
MFYYQSREDADLDSSSPSSSSPSSSSPSSSSPSSSSPSSSSSSTTTTSSSLLKEFCHSHATTNYASYFERKNGALTRRGNWRPGQQTGKGVYRVELSHKVPKLCSSL